MILFDSYGFGEIARFIDIEAAGDAFHQVADGLLVERFLGQNSDDVDNSAHGTSPFI